MFETRCLAGAGDSSSAIKYIRTKNPNGFWINIVVVIGRTIINDVSSKFAKTNKAENLFFCVFVRHLVNFEDKSLIVVQTIAITLVENPFGFLILIGLTAGITCTSETSLFKYVVMTAFKSF